MDTTQNNIDMTDVDTKEEARRATGVVSTSAVGKHTGAATPDPEVTEKTPRRRFTAKYKIRILKEADKCSPSEIGSLLRREGLYSSHLSRWRKQAKEGALSVMMSTKRGRKENPDTKWENKLAQRDREIARLESRLKQAETIIDVQKKLSNILGIELPVIDRKENTK